MKIAAICAYSASGNTGMVSVDLALYSEYVRSLKNFGATVTFYNVENHKTDTSENEGLSLEYKKLPNIDALASYDRVVFWGDFLHSRHYQESGLKAKAKRIHGEGYEDAWRSWNNILRMKGADLDLI